MAVPTGQNANIMHLLTRRRIQTIFVLGLLGSIVGSMLILCAVPPVSRDAMTHHLAVPKLYLQWGGIREIPDLIFSYYPMNLDFLYLIFLAFGNDILPKYIHLAFGLVTAGLIYHYLARRLDRWYGLAGAVFFLSLPIIVKLGITAYVDLGLVCFSTAALIALIQWMENGFQARYLILSASLCGLALGTKYNGLILFFLMAAFVPLIYLRVSESRRPATAMGYGSLFALVALILFSPWLIRNLIWTGNPLYPLFDSLFNPDAPRNRWALSHFLVRHLNYGESWWEIALIPLRVFFQGEDGNPKYFDGKLNPLLLFLPIAAFVRNQGAPLQRQKRLLLAFSVLFLLFSFFQTDMRIRYISPSIPPLVMLSMFGLQNLVELIRRMSTRWSSGLAAGILAMAGAFGMGQNALYIADQFAYVDPIPYLAGKVDRDTYIERYIHEYPVIQYINRELPEDARILSIFLGNRGYYSDRAMVFDESHFRDALRVGTGPVDMAAELKRQGLTHLLIRHDLFNQWVIDNFNPTQIRRLQSFFNRHLIRLVTANGYGLYRLVG